MQEMLSKLPFVRDIHPERRVTRALMWDKEGVSPEAARAAGCSLWQDGDAVGSTVRKRPGRYGSL